MQFTRLQSYSTAHSSAAVGLRNGTFPGVLPIAVPYVRIFCLSELDPLPGSFSLLTLIRWRLLTILKMFCMRGRL
jgi:hypothetical protein